jgi:hypothetical protein
MATCLAELGQITESLNEFQILLEAYERRFEPDDLEVLDLRRQIGLLLASSGDVRSAWQMLTRLLADCERVLGPDDPEVVDLREMVARLRRISG